MNGEPNTQTPQPPHDSQAANDFLSAQDQTAAQPQPLHEPIVWTSSRDSAGHKSKTWYMALLAGSAAIAALVYLVSKDVVSSVAIVIAAALFGAFSIRQPHAVHYVLDGDGITVGQKHFMLGQFRSFSIIDEGGHESVALMPLKRFLPLIVLSYDSQLHQQIVNALAERLPFEVHKRDALDAISSRIKF